MNSENKFKNLNMSQSENPFIEIPEELINELVKAVQRRIYKFETNNLSSGEIKKFFQQKQNDLEEIQREVYEELESSIEKFGSFNSAHEGYAILLEEVEELKEHVFTNQLIRNIEEMKKEAIQVAAMAMKFILDCC